MNIVFHHKSKHFFIVVMLALVLLGASVFAQDAAAPESVTIAGTIQGVLGCPGDWQPECEVTHLAYDSADDVWQASFDLPAGDYEYKAALNGSWDENYGANAEAGGANVALSLAEDMTVTFLYDHKTHWVTDTVNTVIYTAPGSYQDEIGCPGDWQPDCLRSWLEDPDGNGIYNFATTNIPAGDYEVKVAVNQSWDENYGAQGEANGANIPFSVGGDGFDVNFGYSPSRHFINIKVNDPNAVVVTEEPPAEVVVTPGLPTELPTGNPNHFPEPDNVSIPGTIQHVLGCPGDWQPECADTQLQYNEALDIWSGTFDIPAGSYEYKAALNNSWDNNYGLNAEEHGANIPLDLAEDTAVTFYYDHKTGWITDNVNSVIATAPGSYQSAIGCAGDWQPECLRSWLQDSDGDGVYVYTTASIPAGDYEVKVALNLTWDVNYGADAAPGGANIPFTVPVDFALTQFSYDSATNLLTVAVNPDVTGGAFVPGQGAPLVAPVAVDQPDMVVIPGTIQSVVGCDGDWQSDGACTALSYDEADTIWEGVFDIPAGSYEYKVAINGSWDENYGGYADAGGPNVPLNLDADTTVKFYYSNATHWVANSVDNLIATAPGSYQAAIGCPGDWQPDCLRSWLQDPDGDGVFTFVTSDIPAGDYEVKVAINESWDVNYGADGEPGGANIPFNVPEDGSVVAFAYNSATNELAVGIGVMPSVGKAALPDLTKAQAHWVTQDTIAWDLGDVAEDTSFALNYALEGGLAVSSSGITNSTGSIPLTVDPNGLSDDVLQRFPQLAGFTALKIAESDLAIVPGILKMQFAVSSSAGDATSLQIPGVLDDLYTYAGSLGVTYDGDVPTLSVWAPTAQRVRLHLFDDSNPETKAQVVNMTLDREHGVWSVTGDPSWTGKYYLYEVKVYAPAAEALVTNLVTDPYSFSLSLNSERSQIVNLNDPALMPEGWNDLVKPELNAPEDIVEYELHVRDFSAFDETVPEAHRGTFLAFTDTGSNGMQHLAALAQAGLTHVHLLPSFDIATINENAAERTEPDYNELAALPGDSDQQQAILGPIRDLDAYNWGYDPYHYTVPEGSYSTDPDGSARILEFRQMVQALNQTGLRLTMDVVYNHTNASGQADRSVLDRIVPGYYHRLNKDGRVETSTCCQNTATEHNMMERLMVDSIVTWATAYKVDSFRFDLMGHHMLRNMEAVRAALDALTIENSGVDGSQIYVYGEGWDFGEVAGNQRGVNATQLNVGGTGIGTFNDRLRDSVRGGSPFGDRQFQGFISGLSIYPNGLTGGTPEEQAARMLLFADRIRVGMAGNLRDYTFTGASGETITGADVDYNGSPTGYTLDPQENIVYISAHDNETLWDIIEYKDLGLPVSELVRIQNLGNDIVLLSQGVPFFQAGDDMLRSKSLDRDSYNSGDWFNRLDFTYQTNNWAVGLPPEQSNAEQYPVMQPLLAKDGVIPSPDDIMSGMMNFREFLQIRFSSPLFRLQTAAEIQSRLAYLNTGPNQTPGMIVMSLSDTVGENLDPNYAAVVVVINATDEAQNVVQSDMAGQAFELHPVLVNSYDPIVTASAFDAASGTFSVPARTVAVFVLPE
ncbi:MAG: pullulanase-type alpha-1,6-glucosidase [Anaerolineaceae bacterium]|nr:pullulanase-type alpha-1,6-glucosidase [Anaerolineaceae bacterium]